ncbi:MAG: GNAT family N-acetyltransferase [Bacteroidota bacterium]|nr:GNAT family N-acetyltransferase [Bacteroidota bacterium]
MKIILETERLILREMENLDEEGMFELDSNPKVHKYLGKQPVTSVDQIRAVIQMIQKQYQTNGVARWAVIKKDSQTFIGWCGLKLVTEEINNFINYYDLGYRFIEKYWGQGFATESSNAVLNYGFNHLHIKTIYAMADLKNTASIGVLEKLGFKSIHEVIFEGENCLWFELHKVDFKQTL